MPSARTPPSISGPRTPEPAARPGTPRRMWAGGAGPERKREALVPQAGAGRSRGAKSRKSESLSVGAMTGSPRKIGPAFPMRWRRGVAIRKRPPWPCVRTSTPRRPPRLPPIRQCPTATRGPCANRKPTRGSTSARTRARWICIGSTGTLSSGPSGSCGRIDALQSAGYSSASSRPSRPS